MQRFDAQADLLVRFVEVNYLCGNLFAYLQNIRGLLNVLFCDLGNMKQSINAGFQL